MVRQHKLLAGAYTIFPEFIPYKKESSVYLNTLKRNLTIRTDWDFVERIRLIILRE
jgi:hypothetical protein